MSDSEVLIGGQRMVDLRGSVLIPADLEVTANAGEHYRRVSEFLATQAERGQAPGTRPTGRCRSWSGLWGRSGGGGRECG